MNTDNLNNYGNHDNHDNNENTNKDNRDEENKKINRRNKLVRIKIPGKRKNIPFNSIEQDNQKNNKEIKILDD